ncbi:Protein tyrosine kinase [Carpediemonas membranifera]|uniref:Protein tyrosine kinase n=1 Tax=Carpediemonas membranifera TaxID=201153 RepID=A0A8J6B6W7_9EUKA|nr:Protein tyrosine kinase [Carpediemonas membranifera]|eukprot:KAG9394319.1 Protein tyrosine kinase [Carpediemonas membranifera]
MLDNLLTADANVASLVATMLMVALVVGSVLVIALFALVLGVAGALFVIVILLYFIVDQFTEIFRRHGPSRNENVMVPNNPCRTQLVHYAEKQVKVRQRICIAEYPRKGLDYAPFEDGEIYTGKVKPLKRMSRVLCSKLNTPEHQSSAAARLAAAHAQHMANIIGISRIYGFSDSKKEKAQFIFKEEATCNLEARLPSTRSFPWETRLQMARDVATTMAQAHAQGLTHGNLCGTTILVFNDHAKIDDFGIDPKPGIKDLRAHDVEQFGRVFWRVVYRKPIPYSPADMVLPPPEGCPEVLHRAVMACVSPEKPDFTTVCRILGAATLRSAPPAQVGPYQTAPPQPMNPYGSPYSGQPGPNSQCRV